MWHHIPIFILLILYNTLVIAQKPIVNNQESKGNSLYESEQYSEAIPFYEQAIKYEKEPITNKAELYYKVSRCYEGLKKYPKAITKLEIAIEICSDSTKYYNNIATYYFFQKKYQEALFFYKKALQNAKQNKEPLTKCYVSIANTFNELGDYAQSVRYYELTINNYKKQDETLNIVYLVQIQFHLGDAYEKQGDEKRALEYYKKAKKMYEYHKLKLPLLIARIYMNLGNVYDALEKYDKAIFYYRKALNIFRLEKDILLIAQTLNNLGDCYRKLKKWGKAEKFLFEALYLKLKETQKDTISIASSHNNIGELYLK